MIKNTNFIDYIWEVSGKRECPCALNRYDRRTIYTPRHADGGNQYITSVIITARNNIKLILSQLTVLLYSQSIITLRERYLSLIN